MKRYWAMKWATYLEQPGLKQAKNRLIENGAKKVLKSTPKCCLGHLEFMVGTKFEKVTETLWSGKGRPRRHWQTPEQNSAVLSSATVDKVGMNSSIGSAGSSYIEYQGKAYEHLADANDKGVPLKGIAKMIRENWKDL